jgi:hypothetical protein
VISGYVQDESLAVLVRIVGSDPGRWQHLIDEITRRATMMTLQQGIDSVRCDVESGRL